MFCRTLTFKIGDAPVNYFKFKLQGRFMPKVIEAVYENGVFKPLEKVDLPEGVRVRIRIEDIEDLLKGLCGLIESKISLEDIKRMRAEVKTWRRL